MTNANYIQWLETMIVGCDDLGGMEREKAIYQNCLKKARNLGQTLPIQNVSNNEVAVCDHSHGFYFDEKGIITCARCHPPKK